MHKLSVMQDEIGRLASLAEYGILEPLADPVFDRLIQLATNIFHAPIVLITLVGADTQVFAASSGISICKTPRNISFCSHALLSDDILIIPDAQQDPRFHANPLVTGPPFIRFYAGCPLRSPTGYILGTLCVIDTQPRLELSESEQTNLRDLCALVLDKLEMRRLDRARKGSQLQFENLAKSSPDAIICASQDSLITFWNPAAEKLLGYASHEVIGRSTNLFTSAHISERLRQIAADNESLLAGHSIVHEMFTATGSSITVEVSGSMWRAESGEASFCSILRDITERREQEDRLFRLAHIDSLTALPNRVLLKQRCESTFQTESHACVMMIDLDGFKDVNDSLGHNAGDEVLIQAAQRLKSSIRTQDTVARMGGDEFALLVPGLTQGHRAAEIADSIIVSLSQLISVDGEPVMISASVGIALFPDDGLTVQELLTNADLALYKAKTEGKNCYRFYDVELRNAASLKRAYQAEFRRAFDLGEFELLYHAQVRLSDGALVGAEAILHWKHPVNGLLTPVEFLPILDTSLLATSVGDWILRTACQQASKWRSDGMRDFRVSINLFSRQFSNNDLSQSVYSALQAANLPANALELNITENIIRR
ncbi:MAG: diguanylate cyclase, partial [Proteobacteria bacterium]